MENRNAEAEAAYQRAAFHWSVCVLCHRAARDELAMRDELGDVELCATGRVLADCWTRAERRAAGIHVYPPTIVY